MCKPLAAALALTTQGSDLQAGVTEAFFVKTEQGAALKKAIKSPPQCVSNSEAASGPHTSLQGTDALASLSGSRNITTRTTDTHPRGWVRRAGNPPALRGVFLSIFFLRRRRKNMAPGGRQPACPEKIKTQRLPPQ